MPGWKNWNAGELVSEPDFQSLLQDQTVAAFASAAARTAAGWAAPTHAGALTYLQDIKQYQAWTGAAWVPAGGVMPWLLSTWTGTQLFPAGWTVASQYAAVLLGGGAAQSGAGFTFPAAGQVAYRATMSAVVGSVAVYQAGIGSASSVDQWGGGAYSPAGQPMYVLAAGVVAVTAGAVIAPWFYSSVATDVKDVRFEARYLGPTS